MTDPVKQTPEILTGETFDVAERETVESLMVTIGKLRDEIRELRRQLRGSEAS